MCEKEKLLNRFGSNLKEIRLNKGFSQEELGSICRLDRTYISGLERGVRNPSLTCICRLSKGLGVSLDFLLEGIVF